MLIVLASMANNEAKLVTPAKNHANDLTGGFQFISFYVTNLLLSLNTWFKLQEMQFYMLIQQPGTRSLFFSLD